MMKRMGWLLSDHSSYLAEQASTDRPEPELPEMSFEQINLRLQHAWEKSQIVSVQINALYDGEYLPLIQGAAVGFAASQLYLQLKTGHVRMLQVEDIRHVDILDATKWWAE